MSELIRAIKRMGSPREIARLAEEEKETMALRNENSPLQVALSLVEYDPSLSDEYLHRTDYLRGIFHALLDHGADASILHDVKTLGDIVDPPLLHKLLSRGFRADTQDDNGNTLFMVLLFNYSVIYDYREEGREYAYRTYMRSIEDMLEILLANGADVSIQAHHDDYMDYNDGGGNNAIHMMMRGIITPFILQLLRRVANKDNINIPNSNGITPYIQYAMTRGQLGGHMIDLVPYKTMVNVLVEAGANPLDRDNTGKSALDYAIEHHNNELIPILQKKEVEFKHPAQRALISKTRQGQQYGITPSIAKRITNFLGGRYKRNKTRKGRTQKGRKARKAHTRRRK